MKKFLPHALLLCTLVFSTAAAHAEDFVLTIKDHQFSPKELTVPAGQKIKLVIKNEDATPAEFESHGMKREKVVGAKAKITVFVGPLSAGRYEYFDDFHRDTTSGVIVAQ